MVPNRFRLRLSSDFAHVLKRGRRVVRPSFVMYSLPGGPSFGVIVGKKIGGAVVRNRVKRRLRHMAAGLLDDSCAMNVIVRALPPAASAPDLGDQFASAWAYSMKKSESAPR